MQFTANKVIFCNPNHPSIHPSLLLIYGEVTMATRKEMQKPLSHTFSSSWGGPKSFPGQRRPIIPPTRSPPRRMCPENLLMETPRRHPNQMPEPHQLTPFDVKEQQLDSQMLVTLSPRLVWPPCRGSPFQLLVSCVYVHLNVDRLFLHHNSLHPAITSEDGIQILELALRQRQIPKLL